MAANIARASLAGNPMAKPSDAPMNGAVQGEATATANTPVKNASGTGCRACMLATEEGNTLANSNSPDRFNPISVNNSASAATTAGSCNWKPQPRLSPAPRSPSASAPRARKLHTTPAL